LNSARAFTRTLIICFSSQIKARTNIQRALTVLGAICRHHETPFEDVESDEEGEDGVPAGPLQLTWTNLPALCERLFTKFLEKRHVETKCSALRALSGMFVAHPRELFAMDQSGLITQVMSAEAHPSLQLESLQCWRDILLAEEARIESGEAKAKMDANKGITLSKKIAGDQDGDATLFGGVLTSHASRLFEMTQCRDKNLRFAALDLVGHLLRQGQVNPNEAVPFLLALQGDVDEDDVRSLALKLLMIEGEKRPDMLRQRVCAGVKQASVFQSIVYPDKPEVSALVRVVRHGDASFECVFGSVFRECIASITKQRHGLFRNLLGLFNVKDRAGSLETKARKSKSSMNKMAAVELPLLSFAAQVLAHLPYTVASDPLYIIHHITSTVALQGADLLDRLSSLLRPYGLSSSDEYDESNTGEDDLERAATRNIPTHAKEATPLLQSDFDAKNFAELCGEAAAITLLLRLKTFLRRVYNLTESRILGYDPEAKERIADKVSVKSSSLIFQSSIPMKTFSSDAKDIDMDALILQYSEFRRLMRAEAITETRYSDSEEEMQTPSKNKRSRRADDNDDDDED
jgi:cohesin loading factor subunit SCC2